MKTPRPFDQARSLRLDALIIALEARPSALRRTWLRVHKRWLERRVPAFQPQTSSAQGVELVAQ